MAARRETCGFLNLLKPPGMTSHDAVAFVRRRLGGVRVGHLGTLDPLAAGVLPLAAGGATRLIPYLPPARKIYRAEIAFGMETATLDGEGEVVCRSPPPDLTRPLLEEAAGRFQGRIMQVPPRVSAIRRGGVRGYERSRRGEEFEFAPRPAVYHRIEVLRVGRARALLEVECEPGTYVRALARDLGRHLGCGAYLAFLVRLRSGPFRSTEASTLEEVLEAARRDGLAEILWSPARTLDRAGVPAAVPSRLPRPGAAVAARSRHPLVSGQAVRLLTGGGELVGIGTVVTPEPLRVRLERRLGRGSR